MLRCGACFGFSLPSAPIGHFLPHSIERQFEAFVYRMRSPRMQHMDLIRKSFLFLLENCKCFCVAAVWQVAMYRRQCVCVRCCLLHVFACVCDLNAFIKYDFKEKVHDYNNLLYVYSRVQVRMPLDAGLNAMCM